MTPAELVRRAQQQLSESGCMDADIDAYLLYEYVFGTDRTSYMLHRAEAFQEDPHTLAKLAAYEEIVRRRAGGVPVQYLTGTAWFMGLPFSVDPSVLIPRADTELLVETALEYLQEGSSVLDLCTGSGCIILSLARLGRPGRAAGSDISAAALAVAKKNRTDLGLDRVEFIESNLFEHIQGRYDMIVSNPPYIPSGQIPHLMREVSCYEPRTALDGSEDGLAFYRQIARQAGAFLTPGGRLLLEIGYDQAEAVSALLREAGFTDVAVKKDLAGLDRLVMGVITGGRSDV